jgi:hypothetical protein
MLEVRRSLFGLIKLRPLLTTAACHQRICVQHSMPIRHIHQLQMPSITAASSASNARIVSASQLLSVQVSQRVLRLSCLRLISNQHFFLPCCPSFQEYEKQRRAFGELRRPLLKQVSFQPALCIVVLEWYHGGCGALREKHSLSDFISDE